MKIVWKNTGDYLNLDPVNSELAEYWIHQLNQTKANNFNLTETNFDYLWLEQLAQHVKSIHNLLVKKFKLDDLEPFIDANFLDQNILNSLHETWIKLIYNNKNLVRIIKMMNKSAINDWNQINKKIHYIEDNFVFQYNTIEGWEIENPYGSSILSFNKCQISVCFSQKGRTTYNKWINRDDNLSYDDTNDFYQIGGEVLVTLNRPYHHEAPVEYVNLCKLRNLPIIGSNLNLANFSNDTLLITQREILLRNTIDGFNSAFFEF